MSEPAQVQFESLPVGTVFTAPAWRQHNCYFRKTSLQPNTQNAEWFLEYGQTPVSPNTFNATGMTAIVETPEDTVP